MEIKHIAFIMDGNRRFSKKNDLKLENGYNFGLNKMIEFIQLQIKYDIFETTFWALSTENWKLRGKDLLPLKKVIEAFLKEKSKEEEFFIKNKIKINLIGNIEEIKNTKNIENLILKKLITDLETRINDYNQKIKNEFSFIVNICINYGGHQEIIHSFKEIAKKIEKKELKIEDIDENLIKNNIYFNSSNAPEIIVRPGNASRLSGFMSWDSAYSEIYFSEKFWPELDEKDFIKIIEWFKNQKRNFGK